MPTPTPTSFAALLRLARTSIGYSRRELAIRSGLSFSYIRNLEQGVRDTPSWDTVQRLCNAMAINLDELRTLNSVTNMPLVW